MGNYEGKDGEPKIPEGLMQVKRGDRIYVNDSTRKLIESYRKPGELIKPWVLLRYATDACYIYNRKKKLPAYGRKVFTRSLMNTTLPCMVVPNILSWQVQETLDSEVSTASFEALNCLLVSETETTLAAPLSDDVHNLHIWANYATNSYFVTDMIKGNRIKGKVSNQDNNVGWRQYEVDNFSQQGQIGANTRFEFDIDKRDKRRSWKYATDNTMADPGAGYFRLNANKTKMTISEEDADGGDAKTWLDDFRDEHFVGRDYETGDIRLDQRTDKYGVRYRESNLKFRQFQMQKATLASNSIGFPNPSIPRDDDDNDCPDDDFFPKHPNGVGAYYILIGNEIVKVCGKDGDDYLIPPGGRGLGGTEVRYHAAGTKVKLLGFAPFTGETVGNGIFTVDEDNPESSMMRTGHCLTSYEGYGHSPVTDMQHKFREDRNYQFTGYWFIKSCEDSFGEDGVPRVKVELESAGSLIANQQITLNEIQRIKNKFGQWKVEGENLFSASGHTRDIKGDWVDFNSWDPTVRDAYPLKIKTQYAQHKEFYDHMTSTEFGAKCSQCRDEKAKFEKTHKEGPDTAYAENRAIGRHIYKSSIRVLETEAGPIKTYIRLMLTMAMAAWDHPPQGVELAQRFTKIPNKLFDSMRNIRSGLIYNGQLDFKLTPNQEHKYWNWTKPGFDDEKILSRRKELSCPFESTYDKAPFSQPPKDLAEINDAVFWINRRGYPIFMPKGFRLRPSGFGSLDDRMRTDTNKIQKRDIPGEWYLSIGGSVSSYSKSIDTSSIITQTIVTAKSAFDSTFSITCAGTGTNKDGDRILYGGLSGHKQGLALTGGVQHEDTVSMETQMLGLDWNTKPANWGIMVKHGAKDIEIEKKPKLYDGSPPLSKEDGKHHESRTKNVQKTINWFLERRLIDPIQDRNNDEKWWYLIEEDGDYGPITADGVDEIERFMNIELPGNPITNPNGVYDRETYRAIHRYLESHKEWLQHDILWYVYNGRTWQEYVAHIVGLPITMKRNTKFPALTDKHAGETTKWVISDKNLQEEVDKWQKQFIQSAVNVGNRRIDISLEQSIKRTINANFADPRIQIGDIIFTNASGEEDPKGIYITSISRSMDLASSGTYTASYSGYKHKPLTGGGAKKAANAGYDFLK